MTRHDFWLVISVWLHGGTIKVGRSARIINEIFLQTQAFFTPASHSFFENREYRLTRDGLWGRTLSESYIACLSESEKTTVREEVEKLVAKASASGDMVWDEDRRTLVPMTCEVVLLRARGNTCGLSRGFRVGVGRHLSTEGIILVQ